MFCESEHGFTGLVCCRFRFPLNALNTRFRFPLNALNTFFWAKTTINTDSVQYDLNSVCWIRKSFLQQWSFCLTINTIMCYFFMLPFKFKVIRFKLSSYERSSNIKCPLCYCSKGWNHLTPVNRLTMIMFGFAFYKFIAVNCPLQTDTWSDNIETGCYLTVW